MTTQNDKIKEKIQKLLNLANDDAAMGGEIDNALRFARRLMLEHNVTEADLAEPKDPHEQAAKTEYAQAEAYSFGKEMNLWEGSLMANIRDLIGTVGCYKTNTTTERRTAHGTVVFGKNGKAERARLNYFYGPAADVRDASEMFHEWVHIIATLARMKYGSCFFEGGRSYCEGFVASICEKVRTIHGEERKLIATENTGHALVVRSANSLMLAKKEHADKWLRKEKGINLRTTSSRYSERDGSAYGSGRTDGAKADFSRRTTLRIGG